MGMGRRDQETKDVLGGGSERGCVSSCESGGGSMCWPQQMRILPAKLWTGSSSERRDGKGCGDQISLKAHSNLWFRKWMGFLQPF